MPVDRPFVDRPVIDQPAARRVAEDAAARWGLSAPQPLRTGMNALFACGDVVLRVGHGTAPAVTAHALARSIAALGVPTVRPVEALALDLAEVTVTGWERVDVIDAPIDWHTVGAAVRRVHDADPVALVPPGYPVPSPTVFPWWDFDALLADLAADLDQQARRGLCAAIERGHDWRARVRDGAVVCHGDVHPGNVLVSAAGPLLIDWDLLCTAAPAWDHAMLTNYAERWAGDPSAYPAFASGYGRSFADDPLTRTIAELRDVAATLMRVRAARRDPAAVAEAERRLRFWRGDPDAPTWHAQ